MKKEHVKYHVIAVAVIIILIAGSFFCGTKYGKNNSMNRFAPGKYFNGITKSDNRGAMRDNFGGMNNGEIISKDDKSITIKLISGGSKIILFSDKTQIMKSSTGTKDDLAVGTSVIVNGSQNKDGSVTAQTVQISPAQPKKETSTEKTQTQ